MGCGIVRAFSTRCDTSIRDYFERTARVPHHLHELKVADFGFVHVDRSDTQCSTNAELRMHGSLQCTLTFATIGVCRFRERSNHAHRDNQL